jgi:phosphate transport system protein
MAGAPSDGMAMLRWDYRTALIELEDQVLSFGLRAQSMIPRALEVVESGSASRARRILVADDDLDIGAHGVEAKIVELLTLQAPVADEMRLLLSLQKVVSSIERVGDYCVNIARQGEKLEGATGRDDQLMEQTHEMGRRAERAVRTGLDCFSQRRVDGVSRVEVVEDQLDLLHEGLTSRLIDHAGNGRPETEWAIRLVLISRQLERIGDHAVGIAEEGAFVATGARRQPRSLRDPGASADS